MVYQFVRRLATPFNEWDAYKLGIIDENGNVLKKRKDLSTIKERDAFGVFDVMILNIKKLLAKLPGGSSKLASYAAALYLIKEWNHFSTDSVLTEDVSDDLIQESLKGFSESYFYYTHLSEVVNKNVHEDGAPANAVGGGNIAGVGVGPQGEPGLRPKQMKSYKDRNKKFSPMPKLKIKEDVASNSTGGGGIAGFDNIWLYSHQQKKHVIRNMTISDMTNVNALKEEPTSVSDTIVNTNDSSKIKAIGGRLRKYKKHPKEPVSTERIA